MDWQVLEMFLKIIVVLPSIVLILYISLKYGGGKLQQIQNGKYIKVIERVPITKENFILIVMLGEKGYIMSSTPNNMEILKELSEEEIKNIQKLKLESMTNYVDIKKICKNNNLSTLYDKLKLNKLKKEDKNEEKK
ncbi:flagellar biosynthetic protein FliO [Clostridium niameyense]|uniref:Flagellar biosynthetic protein FliO n=1 Tax=Clostridium niameyense TaxID=1622073 RepID=A0A6M0R6T1_9CLOT|nr:flagellar biosynthetic protein FliO [Clostridium niameyense]NEZ45901.1 flagellar biosynthetic protein FliO [Clostridium niameyense]